MGSLSESTSQRKQLIPFPQLPANPRLGVGLGTFPSLAGLLAGKGFAGSPGRHEFMFATAHSCHSSQPPASDLTKTFSHSAFMVSHESWEEEI